MNSIHWPAPAKLNLFLHIIGQRADGYHLLQTVFQFVDLCDTLHFHITDDGKIRRDSGADSISPNLDLVVLAARRLQAATACPKGVIIDVDKYIPIGGGVGGGSSDAATTLVALNHLWQLNLPTTVLADIGLTLGADVPVFVHGKAAWGEGVGEVLHPINPSESYYLLIYPNCHVNTTTIFNTDDLTRNTPAMTIRDFVAATNQQAFHNDCEPVVRKLYPEVAKALDWLQNYAQSRLTGTGACVYAVFDDIATAQIAMADVPNNWWAKVVRGHNSSPLLTRLARCKLK